ncbi:hypothetical protein HPB50_000766 [Hyalomma asiaticum]|uniref:Uncharacterized protein n=1 Tax=Hyalomma asiaticum TaxID=266040 RepID=A0ACB7SU91_HYAAI|nr:hypothetical protein HPB50_000766 [Hyalomma asiaticum]
MEAAENDQELSIVRVDESSGDFSGIAEPLQPALEGTPPYVTSDDINERDGVAFPCCGDHQVPEKPGPIPSVQPEPPGRSVLPVLSSEQEWETSSDELSSGALRTGVRDVAAISPWRLKARSLVLLAAVSCSLALAAWVVYRQLSSTPRRFAEMRADQTDSIVADYTDPALPASGDQRDSVSAGGDPGLLLNDTFDDLRLLGAWRRATGKDRDNRVR